MKFSFSTIFQVSVGSTLICHTWFTKYYSRPTVVCRFANPVRCNHL